jgi:hypothetical protein
VDTLHARTSGGWELDDQERVVDGVGVDSMLQFRLERGGDGMKHCQKIKRRQRACLDFMRRKCDTAWWCDDVNRRRGGIGEGKWKTRCQLD